MPRVDDLTDELHATVAARRELGAEHEEMLIAAFLDRLDRRVETSRQRRGPARGTVLTVLGMVLAMPLAAICGDAAGFPGLVVGLGALVSMVYFGSRR